jgi:hypothetical protein
MYELGLVLGLVAGEDGERSETPAAGRGSSHAVIGVWRRLDRYCDALEIKVLLDALATALAAEPGRFHAAERCG